MSPGSLSPLACGALGSCRASGTPVSAVSLTTLGFAWFLRQRLAPCAPSVPLGSCSEDRPEVPRPLAFPQHGHCPLMATGSCPWPGVGGVGRSAPRWLAAGAVALPPAGVLGKPSSPQTASRAERNGTECQNRMSFSRSRPTPQPCDSVTPRLSGAAKLALPRFW